MLAMPMRNAVAYDGTKKRESSETGYGEKLNRELRNENQIRAYSHNAANASDLLRKNDIARIVVHNHEEYRRPPCEAMRDGPHMST